MGLIQAATGAIGGTLADQWIDAFEAVDMGEGIVFTKGSKLRQGDPRFTVRSMKNFGASNYSFSIISFTISTCLS